MSSGAHEGQFQDSGWVRVSSGSTGSAGRRVWGYAAQVVRPEEVMTHAEGSAVPRGGGGGQSWEHGKLMAHQAKGRWVVLCVAVGLVVGVGWLLWEGFVRYEAVGLVTGEVVDVAPLEGGVVNRLYVSVGQRVTRGQVLAELRDDRLRQALAEAREELMVAEAELASAEAMLRWRWASQAEQHYEAAGEHLTLGARLAVERARLEELRIEVGTTRALHGASAATDHELRVREISLAGQERSVLYLEDAVRELGERVSASRGLLNRQEPVLAGKSARVVHLEGCVARLRERLRWREVRSPVDGVVVAVGRQVGERCGVDDAAVSVVDSSSVGVVVFAPQGRASSYSVGDEVVVVADGLAEPVSCRVSRLDGRYTAADAAVAAWHRRDERVLRVFLDAGAEAAALRPGQLVKVPRGWRSAAERG